MKNSENSPNSLKIHDNNENCHDSGFHGIESRLLRRIDDSDDTDSLGKKKIQNFRLFQRLLEFIWTEGALPAEHHTRPSFVYFSAVI